MVRRLTNGTDCDESQALTASFQLLSTDDEHHAEDAALRSKASHPAVTLLSVMSVENVTEWWEWLSADSVLNLSEASQSYRLVVPWHALCASCHGCESAATAYALGGWQSAFAAFARVIRAGEQHRVDVLALCLRRMEQFSTPSQPMASLARSICGATASALGDVHTRLALCSRDSVCASAIVAAMRAWPDDAILQERGVRSLVYVLLADMPHRGSRADADDAVRDAYERHGKTVTTVAEAACAYALAVATEYAVSRRHRRRREHVEAGLQGLERLALSGFYDAIAADYVHFAADQPPYSSELAAFYAAGALRELVNAAKVARSAAIVCALNQLRYSLTLKLHTLAVANHSDRLVRCALSALHNLAVVCDRHRAIYRTCQPKVPNLNSLRTPSL